MDNHVVDSVINSLARLPAGVAAGMAGSGAFGVSSDGAAPVAELGYFAVGFAPMDAIHHEFHDLLADLVDAGDQGEKLLALHEHLLRHCAQEERWMIDTRFAGGRAHAREHETLLEVIAEVRRRFDAGDSAIVQRLAQELPRWFEHHADTLDAALAAHLREFTERTGPRGLEDAARDAAAG
jgi:hemerythrin-like metal-binding protein